MSYPVVSPAEMEQALRYLTDSRDALIAEAEGLSDEQWSFKPAPDRWSVAEVLEHVCIVNGIFVQRVAPNFPEAPAGAPDRDVAGMDAYVVRAARDRTTKYTAPAMLNPTGRWKLDEAVERYAASHAPVENFLLSTKDLRGHVIAHPVGLIDGYEWVLLMAGHCERHTLQILEVKADSKFPVNAAPDLQPLMA